MSRLPIPHFINQIKTKLGFDRTLTASGEDVVDAVNKQSQQIDKKADIPVIVSVSVNTAGASMSAADQAKLTADMVMCWYSGNRSILTSNLSILPEAGTATVTGTASSSTTFTVAFIHSANNTAIASIIPADTEDSYTITAFNVSSVFSIVGNSIKLYRKNGLIFMDMNAKLELSSDLNANIYTTVYTGIPEKFIPTKSFAIPFIVLGQKTIALRIYINNDGTIKIASSYAIDAFSAYVYLMSSVAGIK